MKPRTKETSRLVALLAVLAACDVRGSRAGPAPLLAESFDSASALGAWQQVDGSVDGEGPRQGTPSGQGPASTIALDDGGVRLEGGPSTRRWRALERTAALAGAAAIRVAARMRTDGVGAEGGLRKDCYVYVRFVDAEGKRVGDLRATRSILGTTPWTPIARRFSTPAGATHVTVGLFLSHPGRAWFDDVRVEATAPPAWSTEVSGRYRYHWLGADTVADAARAYNAESFRIAASFLDLDVPASSPPVDYFKYADKALKDELMGDAGNAVTLADGSIHTIFSTDRHEIVHVLARAWGAPPALLSEGLAVHLSGAWQGEPVAVYAKGLADREAWIPLGDILSSEAFRRRPDLATYAIAGALVGWIVAQPGGKPKLRALYGRVAYGASSSATRHAIEDTLGASVESVDADLRAWVRSR